MRKNLSKASTVIVEKMILPENFHYDCCHIKIVIVSINMKKLFCCTTTKISFVAPEFAFICNAPTMKLRTMTRKIRCLFLQNAVIHFAIIQKWGVSQKINFIVCFCFFNSFSSTEFLLLCRIL